MSNQLEPILEQVRTIRQEVARLGEQRKVALSVHVSKEVIADVEERLDHLIASIDKLRTSGG